MPDLREDLGRLADGVGEPVGLDDLAAARRRRERRRRTAGFAGGGVALLAMLVLAASLRGAPGATIVPGQSSVAPPTGELSMTVWPENAINGLSADDAQATLDAGDDSLGWRTDPEQVVERFGRQILGRSMRIESVTDDVDGLIVRAWPCPPGEPVGPRCDVLLGDPLSLRLVQPATEGGGGIWSVESVQSQSLTVSISGGVEREITFDVTLPGDAVSAHEGLVAANGDCAIPWLTRTVSTSGTDTVAVPPFDTGDPSCPAIGAGYVYVYVTDDTTIPSTDPINEPTAIEFPWITIVPITLEATNTSSTAAPTTASPPLGADQGAGGRTVPIPPDLGRVTDAGCDHPPTGEPVIVEEVVRISGCARWMAAAPITLVFEQRDDGVQAGLDLYPIEACGTDSCEGAPIWSVPIDRGPRTYKEDMSPLDPGTYVLVDPVHPTTAAMLVEAS